jgi:N-acetylneuraminic acid mutarotase
MAKNHAGMLFSLCLVLAACDGAPTRDLTGPESEAATLDVAALAASNTWATKTSIPASHLFAKAGAINGIIYVVGGENSSSQSISTVRAYNIATNTWSIRASLPGNRSAPNGASVINGRLYVSGGISNTGGASRNLFVYNPTTNTWLQKANMPHPAACGAQGVINGLLYVYAPPGGSCGALHGFYRYNPATNTWTVRATPPSLHVSPVAGVIAGKFYLAGGTADNALNPNLALHVYTPATNSWATRAPLPSKHQYAAGGALDGKLYVAGGANFDLLGAPPIGTVRVYDPGTNAWATKVSMLTPRYYAAGINAGGLIWVISGWAASGRSTKVEAYTP